MKCQKCAKPAVVHLTEVVSGSDGQTITGVSPGQGKRAVEIHLCLNHAVEAGLLTPAPDAPPPTVVIKPEGASGAKSTSVKISEGAAAPGAIVPASSEPGGLAVTRGGGQSDAAACPVCGIHWNQFKQGGLMGCPHDYEQFSSKLLPLLKRAQEGATEHIGKIPRKKKTPHGDRQVQTLRLRRQLQQAIDAENYEQAALLRDELRQLERN